MGLGIPQILLAIGGGLGDRRKELRAEYRNNKQRQRDYWDVNGAQVYGTMQTNKNNATAAGERLLEAGLTQENLLDLAEINGIEAVLELDEQFQALSPARQKAMKNKKSINNIIKFSDDFENKLDDWRDVVKREFEFADLTPVERETGSGFFASLKDRITGADLEDEHNQFMDDEFINGVSIRQLKEARGRVPTVGDTVKYTDDGLQMLTPYDYSPTALRFSKQRVEDNLLSDLKTSTRFTTDSELLERLTQDSNGDTRTAQEILSLLRKGGLANQGYTKEDYHDYLKEVDANSPLTAADAAVLGYQFDELTDILNSKSSKEQALEDAKDSGDIPDDAVMDDFTIFVSPKDMPEDFEGLVYFSENKVFENVSLESTDVDKVMTGFDYDDTGVSYNDDGSIVTSDEKIEKTSGKEKDETSGKEEEKISDEEIDELMTNIVTSLEGDDKFSINVKSKLIEFFNSDDMPSTNDNRKTINFKFNRLLNNIRLNKTENPELYKTIRNDIIRLKNTMLGQLGQKEIDDTIGKLLNWALGDKSKSLLGGSN